MAYRNETDALRARVAQLEERIEGLERENAALRGHPASANERGLGERLLGGPVAIEIDRELPVALPPRGHERVLETLRSAFGSIGEASVVGDTLTWRLGPPTSQRTVEVVVTTRDGRTRMRILERLGALAGGLFGGIVGGAGGGGATMAVAALALTEPAMAPVAALAWVGVVYGIVRMGFGAAARRRQRVVAVLAEDLEAVIRKEASRADAGPKVRVASAENAELEGGAETARRRARE